MQLSLATFFHRLWLNEGCLYKTDQNDCLMRLTQVTFQGVLTIIAYTHKKEANRKQ